MIYKLLEKAFAELETSMKVGSKLSDVYWQVQKVVASEKS